MIENNDGEYKYIDGGWGCNNPTIEVYRSIKQLNDNDSNAISMIVSIGTGEVEIDESRELLNRFASKFFYAYVNAALKLATDSETTHYNVVEQTRDHDIPYYRLNVKKNLGNMKLDAFHGKGGRETLTKIEEATNAWLATPEAIQQIEQSAQRLVGTRRRRAHHQGPSSVGSPSSGLPPTELPANGLTPAGSHLTSSSSLGPSPPESSLTRSLSDSSDDDWRDRLFLWERFVHGVEYRCQDRRVCKAADNDSGSRDWLRNHLMTCHSYTVQSPELEAKLDSSKVFP